MEHLPCMTLFFLYFRLSSQHQKPLSGNLKRNIPAKIPWLLPKGSVREPWLTFCHEVNLTVEQWLFLQIFNKLKKKKKTSHRSHQIIETSMLYPESFYLLQAGIYWKHLAGKWLMKTVFAKIYDSLAIWHQSRMKRRCHVCLTWINWVYWYITKIINQNKTLFLKDISTYYRLKVFRRDAFQLKDFIFKLLNSLINVSWYWTT